MSQFWKWNAQAAGESELIIEGVIASESWYEDDVTPKMFRDELKEHSGDVTVRVNSPGGDVSAGISIYNMLNEHEGNVTIKVDGLAASIASLIAMAGDKIVMLPGSMMMVHNPWTFAAGNADDMAQVVEMLEKTGESMIPIYSARTGQSEEKIKELLKAETWLTAQDAVDLGFADEAIEPKTSLADALAKIKSLTPSMKSAVMQPVMSLKAKEEAEEDNVPEQPEESPEVPVETAPVVDEETEEEEIEVEQEVVDQAIADNTTITGETVNDDGSITYDAEVDTDKIIDQIKESEMTEQEKVAAAQVIEPSAQATVDAAPKVTVKDYLKTDEAMEQFATILNSNPSDMGNGGASKVRNLWKEHLETKAGVTNPEIFLPTPLITAIQNAFEDGGEIWNRVSKVGADMWNAAWDTEDDVNSNDGRARGYNRADEENKAEQVLTFDDRIIRPQFVYKYITLNKEDIKEQRSTGALVTYILSELPQRIVREVERAIVLGDGRASDNDYKIKAGDPRGFYPILADAVAGNFFADELTVVGDEASAELVAKAIDEIRTPGEVVLIAKKGYATAARFEKNTDGDYLFPIGTRATDILGVNTIIEPDWFNDTNSPDVDAIVVVLSGYKVVGDTSIEGFQNFILKTNKQEYLQEIWAGGGLSTKKAAIAIPAPTS
jgi:ATP-dependent Clp protease, protease subunit